jgi:hypothetical protein
VEAGHPGFARVGAHQAVGAARIADRHIDRGHVAGGDGAKIRDGQARRGRLAPGKDEGGDERGEERAQAKRFGRHDPRLAQGPVALPVLRIGNLAKSEIFDSLEVMWGAAQPAGIAARFARLVGQMGGDVGAARARGQQLELMRAVDDLAPATLNQVAARVGRGAPAVSRAIDALVRSGLVERQPDPDNRRRLQLRLSASGKADMVKPASGDASRCRARLMPATFSTKEKPRKTRVFRGFPMSCAQRQPRSGAGGGGGGGGTGQVSVARMTLPS